MSGIGQAHPTMLRNHEYGSGGSTADGELYGLLLTFVGHRWVHFRHWHRPHWASNEASKVVSCMAVESRAGFETL